MWIFNIVFINIFMKYIMKTPIYKHQYYILIFIFSINIILIIVSSSIKNNEESSSFYNSLIDTYGNFFYIIIFYIIYLILSALICSSQVFQKKLMDSYYISPIIILLIIGVISILFTIIALIISTNVKCVESFTEKNICTVSYINDQNNNTFIDNFNIYLFNMRDKHEASKVNFYLEIFLVYPLYSFACFMKYFYETLVVLYLNPNYVIISDKMYYSLKMIVILINNPKDIATYLTLVGEIIALIGYCFYLEIFEIKCFGLNKDYKIRISERGILEKINDDKTSNFEEEEEDLIEDDDFENENDEDIASHEQNKKGKN